MERVVLRERQRYSYADLVNLFGDKVDTVCTYLEDSGILQRVDNLASVSDLEKVAFGDRIAGSMNHRILFHYVFDFVGIALVAGYTLCICPKYESLDSFTWSGFKQVLKVIDKYNHCFPRAKGSSGDGDVLSVSPFELMMSLYKDYFDNGLYFRSKELYEINGAGEVSWDRTVNGIDAVFIGDVPVYLDLVTVKNAADRDDFFRRLHHAVIADIGKTFLDTGLLELFGLTPVDLVEYPLDSFGDIEVISYKINNELRVQFNSRRRDLLTSILSYLQLKESAFILNNSVLFGTFSFNLVWERVCAKVLNSKFNEPLKGLVFPSPVPARFEACRTLADVISPPKWRVRDSGGEFAVASGGALRPDLVCFDEVSNASCFHILDAKYYVPNFSRAMARGVPGVSDITKQYFYAQSLRSFAETVGFSRVTNGFLFPSSGDLFEDGGSVSLEMMAALGLEDIQLRFLPARVMFEHYLNDDSISVSLLNI